MYRVFNGNCGKAILFVLLNVGHLREKNIRNKKITIKSFLVGFQFALEYSSLRFDASLGKTRTTPWFWSTNSISHLCLVASFKA